MRWNKVFVWLLAAAPGCLPDSLPVDGRSLFPGRDVEKPSFLTVAGRPAVMFEERTTLPTPSGGGASNLWIVDWENAARRRLVANKSDRWGPSGDSTGARYYMRDEKKVEDPATAGATAFVATLARVSLEDGEIEGIPGVLNFGVGGSRFYYRRLVAGSSQPELHLRDPGGNDRLVVSTSGQVQFGGRGGLYFMAGDGKKLSRLRAMDAEIEDISAHVLRFALRGDERFVILTILDAGKTRTVALPIDGAGAMKPLPGQPCCWLGFSGDSFVYSESAHGDVVGALHAFNLETGVDSVLMLPPGLADVSGIIGRPESRASLLADSQGRLALYDGQGGPPRLLDLKPLAPGFSPDGRFLLYVDPQALTPEPEGRLMIQDADFRDPPRVITPLGTRAFPGDYFFSGGADPLVFWAHLGRGASDLYFANPDTGQARVVAQGIRQVNVSPQHVVGIIRVSQQDLVGDLVIKEATPPGAEQVLAYSVSDVTISGSMVAFIVRERISSGRNGLWATSLPGK